MSDDQSPPAAVTLARQFFRAIQARDKEAMLPLLAEDFVLEVPYNVSGTNDLSDSWHGLEAASANFTKTWACIELVKYAELEITPCRDDNVAFAEALGDMRLANGRPYRNRYVFRFDTADGKILRIREYANPITSIVASGSPWPPVEAASESNESGAIELNKQVALRFIEAMGLNDTEGARDCMAPEGVAIAMGTTKFAGVRPRETMLQGIDAFKQIMPEGLRFTISSVTAEGDRVIVEATGNAITSDGKPYRNDYCKVFTFADGRILELKEYFCTRLADETLWPLAEAMEGLGKR